MEPEDIRALESPGRHGRVPHKSRLHIQRRVYARWKTRHSETIRVCRCHTCCISYGRAHTSYWFWHYLAIPHSLTGTCPSAKQAMSADARVDVHAHKPPDGFTCTNWFDTVCVCEYSCTYACRCSMSAKGTLNRTCRTYETPANCAMKRN